MTHDATQVGETTSVKRAAPREADELAGKTVGDFRILRRLGEGGMGQVYLAEQVSLKRRVALKLLRQEFATNEVSRKRFEAEAKAVAQLTHPSIVQVHSVGEENGVPYMALEYVDGRNLRDYLLRKGPPEVPAALSVMRQVASALHRASELGIIHRDIKPENILLTKKGEVKVADFGLSRVISESQPANNLTQTGVSMGTPLYMSPEQVEGRTLDHRTDIYSFGVTCYHMLAGHPPFEGENAFAVAIQHVQNDAMPLASVRPDLPPALCDVVNRMMEKNPADRYQTPREILQDLKKLSAMLAGGETQRLLAQSMPKAPPRPISAPGSALTLDMPIARKWKWLLWGGAVVGSLVLTVVAGALIGWAMREPNDDPLANVPDLPKPAIDLGPLTAKQTEEAHLTLVRNTANPEPDKISTGVRHRIDLALFYLDKTPRELDKAESLFTELLNSSVQEYKSIGKTGMAAVLAFRDKPEESLQQLRVPGGRLTGLEGRVDLFRYPDWMRTMRAAMDHNRANLKAAGKEPQVRDIPAPFRGMLNPALPGVRPSTP